MRIPKPFKVKQSIIHTADGVHKIPYYTVNDLPGVILCEGAIDKQLIQARCSDRNTLFKAGAEWAIKHMKKTRKR